MKIKRKHLKILIESLLNEETAEALSGAATSYNYDNDTGIYSSVKADQDPYTYKVEEVESDGIIVKVVGAPDNRKSAIGKTFKITKNNMDNPNVQLLFSSMAYYQQDVSGSDFYKSIKPTETVTKSAAEYVNLGKFNNYSEHDKAVKALVYKQINAIKSIGKNEAKDVELEISTSEDTNEYRSFQNAGEFFYSGTKEKSLATMSFKILEEFQKYSYGQVVSIYYAGNMYGDAMMYMLVKSSAKKFTLYDSFGDKYDKYASLSDNVGEIGKIGQGDVEVEMSQEIVANVTKTISTSTKKKVEPEKVDASKIPGLFAKNVHDYMKGNNKRIKDNKQLVRIGVKNLTKAQIAQIDINGVMVLRRNPGIIHIGIPMGAGKDNYYYRYKINKRKSGPELLDKRSKPYPKEASADTGSEATPASTSSQTGTSDIPDDYPQKIKEMYNKSPEKYGFGKHTSTDQSAAKRFSENEARQMLLKKLGKDRISSRAPEGGRIMTQSGDQFTVYVLMEEFEPPKGIVQEGLSRGSLYRKRYWGRY